MATNQTGISITIKAWLPVTGSISEQIAKLQMVEAAHTTGDYAELLKASSVEDIKTEQKTRRIEDAPATTATKEDEDSAGEHGSSLGETEGPSASSAETVNPEPSSSDSGMKEAFDAVEPAGEVDPAPTDEAVPEFIKNSRKKSA